ncbi:DUF3017 domain-containing protein [Nocardioides sp.]|jgi:hypothetical protein|uniref:DUF3017 domain-containing protein n=1 Tax=Nocardioides sp. TaxID=35761 RepID=UPI0035B442C2
MTEPDRSEPPEPRPMKPPESVEPVSAEPVDPDEPRRYPSTIGGAFYLLVLAVVAVSMVVVWLGDWRAGIRLMGGSLIFAALVRLVLRTRDAGMLAVRHKLLDAVVLVLLGGALLFLATSIPDQPGF